MRALLAVFVIALTCGCQDSTSTPDSGRIPVLATTGIVGDAVQRIGGEHITVDVLMPAGVDPHRYIPTAGDLSRLQRAKRIFSNGLHLEGKMADVFTRAGARSVAITKDIPNHRIRFENGEPDPHVWFDVELWSQCLGTIAQALAELDPPHRSDYEQAAKRYQAELQALHHELLQELATIPAERRVLITSHDAFGYFGAAYGLEVHGLQGVSTVSETTTRDVQALAQLLGTKKIPAIFAETSVPPRGLQAVLDAVQEGYGHSVRLIGGEDALYSDTLGPPGTAGGTYPGMIRHNLRVLRKALGP
jgi:manganese/zinc/iron transport system substrate-binding protein